jgi:hypothetical protein
MKPVQTSSLLILISILFSACDPAQSIYLENQTSAPASVLFTFNAGAESYRFPEAEQSDTFLVRLDSTGASQEIYFGLGTWKIQASVDSLVAAVASIEITSERSSESFVGEQQVRAFLTDRIGKKRKERIEIIIK